MYEGNDKQCNGYKYLDNGNDPNVNDCYVNDPDSNAKFAWTVWLWLGITNVSQKKIMVVWIYTCLN